MSCLTFPYSQSYYYSIYSLVTIKQQVEQGATYHTAIPELLHPREPLCCC